MTGVFPGCWVCDGLLSKGEEKIRGDRVIVVVVRVLLVAAKLCAQREAFYEGRHHTARASAGQVIFDSS